MVIFIFYCTFAPTIFIMGTSKSRGNSKKKTKSWKDSDNIAIKILRWIYHSILLVSTLSLLFVYLLSAFSDHIDPRKIVYLSYLGIGYHIVLSAVIIWMIVLFVIRHWKLGAILAVGLICTWGQVSRYFPLHAFGQSPVSVSEKIQGKEMAARIDSVKILTYNTCGMGQVHLSKIKEKIPVLDVIRDSKADIVCLQEYAFTLSSGGHTQEQIRKSLSDIYPYYDFMPNYSRKAMGIAIFSKYPIKNMVRIDKSKKDYISSMFYELEINNKRVILVNNHLHSNLIKQQDRRLYDEMIEHFEKDSLQRIRTGMLRSLGSGFRSRASQCNLIRKFIKDRIGEEDVPMIICGDMNDTPLSYTYRIMRGNLNDAWQEAGFGAGTTYNKHHFWFRIDHIFHSHHFKALDIEVQRQYDYSDHYPVLATFQLLNNTK